MEMWLNYAFGLMIGNYKGFPMVEHGGGDAGYRSHIIRFPEQRLAVIVHSNHAASTPGALARQVADLFLPGIPAAKALEPKPAEQRITVKVSPALFDSYAGMYDLPGIATVEIARDKDKLFAAAGAQRFELLPESETKYFIKELNTRVEFQKDTAGKVYQIAVQQDQQTMIGKRFVAMKADPGELLEYAGDYYSEELGTTYSIVLKDGKLIAEHRRNQDVLLSPGARDRFSGNTWYFSNVTFTRGSDNRINGLTLSGSRVRNLKFVKKS